MINRLHVFLRHVIYNLRGGFLVRPLVIVLILSFAGAGLSWLEAAFPVLNSWVPKLLFPFKADPEVAQIILGSIATAMMTVVSIVFAILLMTITLASNQFSPRIIVNFSRDKATQQTLGIFLGTFAYCLSALPAAHSLPKPFSPVATVVGAMILALACIAWLLFFIQHISQAISVNYIVDNVARETEAIIDQMMPHPLRQNGLAKPAPPEPTDRESPVVSVMSGYIRFIDTKRLVSLAKTHKVSIRLLRRVGHFAPEGVPLLMVSKGERITPEMGAEFRSVFDLGPTRTLEQDMEFGILQMVDIALKAISPAINDPSTAISCIDQLSRLLIRVALREPPTSLFYDPPGVLRVSVPWLDFDRLVDSAFEQIRLYARADTAVNLRLLRALTDVAATTPVPEYRQTLIERGRRIVLGCAEKLTEGEMVEIRSRSLELEKWGVAISDPARKAGLSYAGAIAWEGSEAVSSP